ncbi:WXG100 family type VII secretion target [Saccharopolyspora sp. NPDC050642]|uniref:WXG100 family type VII secretion target n=1 Tax=Saccharopolyspora sp. NPDC050642 TaxID=3157099 RepID=UPI0033FDBE13
MDRFAVRYAAIGEAWESVRDATGQVRTKLADLDGSLGPLRASWTGQAADSFEVARATWVREAEEMTEFLDGMADLLSLIDENYRSAHQANLAIWDAPAGSSGGSSTVPMSAGSAGGEVDVSIEELRRAARSFHGLQQQLADNMGWISRNLHGSATGMAGADPVLAPWRTLYDETARAVWAVLGAATDLLGGIAQGMTDTGNNYVDSEEASTAGHGATLPERLPQLPVDTVSPGPEPPPSGSGAPAQSLEDWGYEYWPDGDPSGLMFAYGEWRRFVETLTEVSRSGDELINGLVESNRGAVFDSIRQYWATKSQICGTSEILPVLTSACSALSESCKVLSKAVRNAQTSIAKLHQIVDELDIFSALGLLRKHSIAELAGLGYEIGRYAAIKTIMPKIKATYEYERGDAMQLLATGIADRLHAWARDAEAVTLESERRAYDQADHGLEQHLGTAPYDAWAGVDEPHPNPASVHITAERATHILYSDQTGGGHLAGTGKPGKTEFPPPPGWNGPDILSRVQDVAKNPDSPPIRQDNGRWKLTGVRDGVLIEVILNEDGSVRTAYPKGGPGVEQNPRKK